MRAIVGDHLRDAMGRLTAAEQRRMAEAFRYLVTPSGAKIAQRRDDLARLTHTTEPELAAPLEKLSASDARILPVPSTRRPPTSSSTTSSPAQCWGGGTVMRRTGVWRRNGRMQGDGIGSLWPSLASHSSHSLL